VKKLQLRIFNLKFCFKVLLKYYVKLFAVYYLLERLIGIKMKKLGLVLSLILVNSLAAAAPSELLVGTPGDYPPLSYRTSAGAYTGHDIQIIQDFAAAHQLTVKFVATTWSTLNQDLANNKFAVAVGGISQNPVRTQKFLLSKPVGFTQKAALIRCSDRERFSSLAAIDQESVIVVENRGGTNQDFALATLQTAPILLLSDNFKALARLTSTTAPADVMFTDDVEISYRKQLNPELCQAQLAQTFPLTAKVFLFNRNNSGYELSTQFNAWWAKSNQRYMK
jgi:cyclohexadienyl dehydratase